MATRRSRQYSRVRDAKGQGWLPYHTVSGLSSGGLQANVHFMRYSSRVLGLGAMLAMPYHQISWFDDKGSFTDGSRQEDGDWSVQFTRPRAMFENSSGSLSIGFRFNASRLLEQTYVQAASGQIAGLHNVRDRPVFLLVGGQDGTVRADLAQQAEVFYRQLGANVKYEYWAEADHYGETWTHRMVGLMLKHVYGTLERRLRSPSWNVFIYEQTPFVPTGYTLQQAQMAPEGLAFVPHSCQIANGPNCRVHVAYHGCGAMAMALMTLTIGYNDWATSNDLIVYYPTATGLCWMASAADQNDYVQMATVANTIAGLQGRWGNATWRNSLPTLVTSSVSLYTFPRCCLKAKAEVARSWSADRYWKNVAPSDRIPLPMLFKKFWDSSESIAREIPYCPCSMAQPTLCMPALRSQCNLPHEAHTYSSLFSCPTCHSSRRFTCQCGDNVTRATSSFHRRSLLYP